MKVSDKISDAVRMRLEVEQVVYPLLLVDEKESEIGIGTHSMQLLSCCTDFQSSIQNTALLLAAFAKLKRKRKSIGFMSVCPSVCPHGTTRLPLDGFSRNVILGYFSEKNCQKNSRFIKIRPGALSVAYDLHNTTCCHNTKLI